MQKRLDLDITLSKYTAGALTICTEKKNVFYFSDEMSNGTVQPGEIFQNRRNAFEGIPLFSFQAR